MPLPAKPRMSFRNLLVTILLGLILISTGAVAWVGISGVSTALRQMARGQMIASLETVDAQIQALFEPTDRLLKLGRGSILRGATPLENPLEVGRQLAATLVFEEGVTWLSFGYADGSFVGATDRDGQILVNTSTPDGGQPQFRPVLPDGSLGEPFPEEGVERFDSRLRPWFEAAERSPGFQWVGPYDFVGGGRGIGASLAVRDADGRLLGVLAIDYELDDVTDYLSRLATRTGSLPMIFFPDGELMTSQAGTRETPLVHAARELLFESAREEPTNGQGYIRGSVEVGNQIFVIGLQRSEIVGGLDIVTAIAFDRAKTFGAIESGLRRSALTGAAAIVLSLVSGFLLARRVATPLGSLTEGVQRIGRFDLETARFPESSIREVAALSESVRRMRDSLQSFSHYVPVDIVRDLIHSGGVAALGGQRRAITVMFCDLEGFTGFAEEVPPETVVDTLSGYFEIFGHSIQEQGGVIDKFLGDGVMALFNAPTLLPDHASAACRAALLAREAFHGIESGEHGYLPRVRTGLHSGEALVGNVGTTRRFSYTAIGDCVNMASRLEALNKIYGTWIIASAAVRHQCAGGEFLWRRLDRVTARGRREPIEIYELVNWRRSATAEELRSTDVYPEALEAFWRGDTREARRLLEEIADFDPPSRALLQRIAAAESGEPADAPPL